MESGGKIMNKFIHVTIIMLALAMFAGVVSGSEVVMENPVQAGMPPQVEMPDFSKIEISPQYGNFVLKPGESKETTVTIRNKEKEAVSVKPKIVMLPYGGINIDPAWVKVTPDSAEIPAGGSQKFTVKVVVPGDASIGNSGVQIAFTDETMPSPYPVPIPNYIHAFQLSLDIWSEPKVQIMTSYINDMLQANREYDYEIKLKNTGKEAVNIDPKLGSDNRFYIGPFGQLTSTLTDEDITITAPPNIPAGATGIVKMHVKVPAGAKGSYNGGLNLNIDDPSIREWNGRVQLTFNVWTQPTEPFVKSFTMKESAPLTIEISSGFGYPYSMSSKKKEPSFETTLTGPSGNAELKVTKTVIKGGVNMGGDIPPWEIDSTGIYQENGIQLIETYKTNGAAGEWKLKVLPKNTERFDYSITIGE